jgi:flagellar assembly factor FliW
MPKFQTQHFGRLDYDPRDVFHFPAGLPGFEHERDFLPVIQNSTKPLVFLQSLSRADVCFVALPAHMIEPGYRLQMTPEELDLLGLAPEYPPAIGPDLLCLALLSFHEGAAPTANLLAPMVIHLRNNKGVQAIQADSGYSHQAPLPEPQPEPQPEPEVQPCS